MLIGYPTIEYECQIAKRIKDENGESKLKILPGTVWLDAKQIQSMDKNTALRQTGKSRMGYAKPAWVPEKNPNGVILNLDDYTRANPQLLQACMKLILDQEYVTWSLPKGTTVVLTTNSDDGTSNVNSLDEAQSSRFLNYNIDFDLDTWMSWAEKVKLDGRCINFMASYHNELLNADSEGNRICNPRSFVMFAKSIKSIKNWETPESLEFIQTIAKGCFKDDKGRFSSMFMSFIRNKMHLLIQPKDMLLGDWSEISETLRKTVYDNPTDRSSYRPDIASLLERRFCNYVDAWLDSKDKTPIQKVTERLVAFLDFEDQTGMRLFTKDHFYHILKTITAKHKNQTNHILMNPRLAQILIR